MVALIDNDEEWVKFVQAAEQANAPYVFMYSATWCGPCKRIFPLFENLAEQWSNSVRFAKVDVDGARDSAQRQQISSMPTFVAHYRDQTTERCLGADEQQLQTLISHLTNTADNLETQQQSDPNEAQTTQQQEQQQQYYSQTTEQTATDTVVVHEINSDNDWDDFVTFVRSKRLPLVLAFGVDRDPSCQRMQRVFFESAKINNEKCIFAKVDSERATTVNQTFNTSGSIPYYCAYDANGNGKGQFVGAMNSRFIGLVQSAINE